MRRRAVIAVAVAVSAVFGGWIASPALATLREVNVGNFYYEDQTVGDGKVEATIGDQIRFIVQDGGPGTPHTVEVDELGIHSGSILSGKTYTTPPIEKAGTFKLYCKPHEMRGHVTTLVVYTADGTPPAPSTTSTTTAQPRTTETTTTTAAPSGNATSSSTTTTATAATAKSVTTTTVPRAANGVTVVPTTAPAAEQASGSADTTPVTATEATVPSGTGDASDQELADAPLVEGSLEDLLGRRPGDGGPWTRSIKMALAALAPMVLLAGFAFSKVVRRLDADEVDAAGDA